MNALLFEMIAARASATGNPAIAELLTHLRPGGNGAGGSSPQELLTQLGQGNPAAALLARYMTDQQAKASAREQPVVIDMKPIQEVPNSPAEPDCDHDTPEKSSEAMTELRLHVESMFAELQGLRERVDQLAWALGACCLCWGKDSNCRNCRGRGRPGFSMPDEKLFGELVLPAVRVLRAQRVKGNGSSLKMPPGATEPGARLNQGANQNERKTL